MNSTPSSSHTWPKSKRETPVCGSMPIVPRRSPATPVASPFRIDEPTAASAVRPSTTRAKYSGGPKASAARASGGASSMRPRVPSVPAMKEPMAAMPSADAGAPLQGHLVAVDAGHDGARLAGHADEHGGERAAVLRAVIDAGEHDDGGGRARAVGQRQEQGDGGRRSDARQHADHLAEQHAGEAHGEMRRRQRRRETLHEVEERPHLKARAARPGNGTPSQVRKIRIRAAVVAPATRSERSDRQPFDDREQEQEQQEHGDAEAGHARCRSRRRSGRRG